MNGDKATSQVRRSTRQFRDGYEQIAWKPANTLEMLQRCSKHQPDNPRADGMGHRALLEAHGLLSSEPTPIPTSQEVLPEELPEGDYYPLELFDSRRQGPTGV